LVVNRIGQTAVHTLLGANVAPIAGTVSPGRNDFT
jgi:hypothetical protein